MSFNVYGLITDAGYNSVLIVELPIAADRSNTVGGIGYQRVIGGIKQLSKWPASIS